MQQAVDAKSIQRYYGAARLHLLAALTWRGKVVLPMRGTTNINPVAPQMIEQGVDYTPPLKGNQRPPLLDAPATPLTPEYLNQSGDTGVSKPASQRQRQRRCGMAASHAAVAGRCGPSTRRPAAGRRGKRIERYYLLSAAGTQERLNYIVQGHWGIENRLHWALEVTNLQLGPSAKPERALRREPGAAAAAGGEPGPPGGEQRGQCTAN